MKTIIKESLQRLVADRSILILLSSMILLALIFTVIVGVSIQPSELQLISHYSSFGTKRIYTDQWFYLIVFALFELAVATLHSIITTKLLLVKGRSIAMMYAWIGVGVIILGFATALRVITVW